MRNDKDLNSADLLVFGSGAAGLTAALVAAIEGLDVILFEKSALIGGTTATSGGSLWVPGARPILNATPGVDTAQARRYLERELGDWLRSDLLDAFLASAGEAIEYLSTRSAVRFAHAVNPDYHADMPDGSATGHAITAEPFDARELGPEFAYLKPPRDIFMVLGGMMVGRREIPLLVRPFSSFANFRKVMRLLLKHVLDRLSHPRGTRLLIGNALVARYLFSLRQRGVPIECRTKLVELLRQNGRVIGALVEQDGERRVVHARRGVVLATGGIAHSMEWRQQLMATHPHERSMVDECNTGDGVGAAVRAGAVLDRAVSNPGFWSPASVRHKQNGHEVLWIHGHMDRGKPGLMAVDCSGRRFVNEADSYHDFVMAMFANQRCDAGGAAYLICDHRFIREYGLGLVRPRVSRLAPFVRDGYLLQAGSIEALAGLIGVDPEQLAESIQTYNADSEAGVDREFGRGSRILNQFNGDPAQAPNPCMRPIRHPPYYAVKVWPCTIGTTVGLATNGDSRVLDQEGQPIPGLYACGNDMSSVMRGFYPGPGATLGPAVVFGYRAARHLASSAS